MTDIADQIAENALHPKSITVDGESVTEHSLLDQIAADKYAQNRSALRNGTGPVFSKIKPPGTHG